MKDYLQGIGLLVLFVATLLKEVFIEPRQPRPPWALRLYWAFSTIGLGVGLFGTFIEHQKAKAEQASRHATEGRASFHSGLEKGSVQEIQSALVLLKAAQQELNSSELDSTTVAVTHDLALANERLSYADSGGCIYRIGHQESTDQNMVSACRTAQGSAIYVTPKALRTEIRCTDVADTEKWTDAKKLYTTAIQQVTKLGTSTTNPDTRLEIAKAARSAAYFYMCDQLRFGTPHNTEIFDALKYAVETTLDIPDRRLDIINKQAFAQVMDSTHQKSLQCVEPCETAGAPRRYVEFRGRTLGELAGTNVTIQSDYAEIAKGQPTGQLISKKLTDIVRFKEAIASWDTDTPSGSWISVSISARVKGSWTRPYSLGQWSSSDGEQRKSAASDADVVGHVETDTLVLADAADALQLQATLIASKTGAVPRVRSLSVALLGDEQIPPGLGQWSAAHGVDLPVPPLSQRLYSKVGGDAWCSPTSVSMVLAYWANETGKSFYLKSPHAPVQEVANGVFDATSQWHYGNWSFNVAYVNSIGHGDLRAFVTRLYGIEQLERLVLAGFPVIVSAAWSGGTLRTAPLAQTDGHLMVVRGFDRSGDIIVNDPAGEVDGVVKKVYDRNEFDAAWKTKGRTVYLIHPAGRPLPAEGAAGAWL